MKKQKNKFKTEGYVRPTIVDGICQHNVIFEDEEKHKCAYCGQPVSDLSNYQK